MRKAFIFKSEGGERRLDLIEYIGVAKALGTDAVSLFRQFMPRNPDK